MSPRARWIPRLYPSASERASSMPIYSASSVCMRALERLDAHAIVARAVETKALGVGTPGDRAAVGAGFGLGHLQYLAEAFGIFAQQVQRVGPDGQADGGAGDADDHQHHHQLDQGEALLFHR